MPGDIGQEPHCQQLVRRAVSELGRLDILVNNAAFQMFRQGIAETSSEEFDRTLRTNVYARRAPLPTTGSRGSTTP